MANAENALLEARRALDDAMELSGRIQNIVGDLCGHRLQVSSGSIECCSSSNGRLRDLADLARSAAETVKTAHAELDRLISATLAE